MSALANQTKRSPITTHVLDLALGKAAPQLTVRLERLASDGAWISVAQSRTNNDGRIEDWGSALAPGSKAQAGIYRLSFETEAYFKASARESFYPSVTVDFRIENPEQHHHVPLLLSSFGYSTYRGT